ncbi:uncharacterized protein VTP21DRAFT_5344 [Calcarisporiella thermophila]|uniref:uncharacterized protein n=1 Tax=Calcarisporiella thermophila TaxID=911321 RepID=UPI0037444002
MALYLVCRAISVEFRDEGGNEESLRMEIVPSSRASRDKTTVDNVDTRTMRRLTRTCGYEEVSAGDVDMISEENATEPAEGRSVEEERPPGRSLQRTGR